MNPVPLPQDFRPYEWAPSSADVAARHGLRREQVLRFDQNTPPLPGVPQVPLAASFARLNEYPDGTFRELREAAASYSGVEPEQIVVGAGADELIAVCASTFLGCRPPRGGLPAHVRPLPDRIAARGRRGRHRARRRRPDLGLQPEQPHRRAARSRRDRHARTRASPGRRRRRRGVLGVRRRHLRATRRRAAEPDRAANALEGVRLRGAAGRLRGRSSGDGRRARAAAAAGQRLGAGGNDRGSRATRATPRRRGDRRRTRARARGPRCRRPRLSGEPRQLRLVAHGRVTRRAPRGGRDSSSGSSQRESGSHCGGHPRTTSCSKLSARPAARRRGERHSSRARAARPRSASCSTSTAPATPASQPGSAFSITC